MSAACCISAGSRPFRLSSASSRVGWLASARASVQLLQRRRAHAFGGGGGIARQAHQLQRLGRLLPAGLAADLAVLAEPGRQRHVLQHGELVERPRDLEGAADAGVADGVGRLAGDVAPVERDAPARWHIMPGDAVEGGALARAVGADEAQDLAALHLETHAGHGGEAAEDLAQPFN